MKSQKRTEVRILSPNNCIEDILSLLIDNDFKIDANEKFNNSFDFKRMEGENPYSKILDRLKAVAKYSEWTYTKPDRLSELPENYYEIVSNIYKKYKSFKKDKQLLLIQKEQCEEGKERFKLFGDLPVDFQEIAECEFISIRFGHMPKECAKRMKAIYSDDPYVEFFITYETQTDYWGMYFVPKTMAGRIDSIFASLLFETINIPSASGNAKDIGAEINGNIAILDSELETIQIEETEFFKQQFDIANAIYFSAQREYEKFDIKVNALENGSAFIIIGSLDEKSADDVINEIEKNPGAFVTRLKTFRAKTG